MVLSKHPWAKPTICAPIPILPSFKMPEQQHSHECMYHDRKTTTKNHHKKPPQKTTTKNHHIKTTTTPQPPPPNPSALTNGVLVALPNFPQDSIRWHFDVVQRHGTRGTVQHSNTTNPVKKEEKKTKEPTHCQSLSLAQYTPKAQHHFHTRQNVPGPNAQFVFRFADLQPRGVAVHHKARDSLVPL